jgi:hypothetical protein
MNLHNNLLMNLLSLFFNVSYPVILILFFSGKITFNQK